MKKNIILYNHFHNGDIFYSRILVNILLKYFNITYYHNLKSPLFEDLPEISEIVGIPSEFSIHGTNLHGGILNTWIGQNNMHYVTHQPIPGCSFNNHFKLVSDICNFYGIDVSDNLNSYLPVVNESNINDSSLMIEKIQNILNKYKLVILVCDGNVNSGQSHNFNFVPMITEIANNNPDCLFLSTNQTYIGVGNVITIYPEITKKLPDLLNISVLSKYCNIIIGRASGPVCFTHTKDNFNDSNKTFISFSFNESEGIFYYEGINKNVWTNNMEYGNMKTIIQNEINFKKNKL
jgi:hypothetical protein